MARNVKLEENDDLEASDDILQFNNFCVLMELSSDYHRGAPKIGRDEAKSRIFSVRTPK